MELLSIAEREGRFFKQLIITKTATKPKRAIKTYFGPMKSVKAAKGFYYRNKNDLDVSGAIIILLK